MHLTVEEMSTVEKCVSESMVWMNSRMNAQSKVGITQDPVVKVADVISKIQVNRSHSVVAPPIGLGVNFQGCWTQDI